MWHGFVALFSGPGNSGNPSKPLNPHLEWAYKNTHIKRKHDRCENFSPFFLGVVIQKSWCKTSPIREERLWNRSKTSEGPSNSSPLIYQPPLRRACCVWNLNKAQKDKQQKNRRDMKEPWLKMTMFLKDYLFRTWRHYLKSWRHGNCHENVMSSFARTTWWGEGSSLYGIDQLCICLTQPMAKRLKLFGITYLVGKISRSNFFFQGPGRLSELLFFFWLPRGASDRVWFT